MIETVLRRRAPQGSRADGGRRRRVRGAWAGRSAPAPIRRAALQRGAGGGRACSCDRIGCPAPGAHPMSPAWQVEATRRSGHGRELVAGAGRMRTSSWPPAGYSTYWTCRPRRESAALALMERAGVRPGPVAVSAGDRALFFVLTRGTPGRRARMVVLPSGLRARDRDRGDRPALALPGQLRAGPAIPARPRPAAAQLAAPPRRSIRCRTGSGCWSSSPTRARGPRG